MPITRRQAALQESGVDVKPTSKSEKPKSSPKKRGTKRDVEEVEQPEGEEEEPPEKKTKQSTKKGENVSEPKQGGKNEKRPRDGPMKGKQMVNQSTAPVC